MANSLKVASSTAASASSVAAAPAGLLSTLTSTATAKIEVVTTSPRIIRSKTLLDESDRATLCSLVGEHHSIVGRGARR